MVAMLEYMLSMPPAISTNGSGEIFGALGPKTRVNALGNGPLGLAKLTEASVHPDKMLLPPPSNLEVTEVEHHSPWILLMEGHAGCGSRIRTLIEPPLLLCVAPLQGLGE